MRYLLVCVVILVFTGNVLADTIPNEKGIRSVTEQVMQQVAANRLIEAFEIIKKYVQLPPTEIDSVALQSKAQRDQFAERYGQPMDYEFIRQKKVGESLIMVQYIEKTNKHAFPWSFFFYRTTDGWTLNSFNWNDDFKQLFLFD